MVAPGQACCRPPAVHRTGRGHLAPEVGGTEVEKAVLGGRRRSSRCAALQTLAVCPQTADGSLFSSPLRTPRQNGSGGQGTVAGRGRWALLTSQLPARCVFPVATGSPPSSLRLGSVPGPALGNWGATLICSLFLLPGPCL